MHQVDFGFATFLMRSMTAEAQSMRVEPFWTTNENRALSRPRVVTLLMPLRSQIMRKMQAKSLG
jgi:hypothetical protein